MKLIVTFCNFVNRSNDSCFVSNQGVSCLLHVPTYSCTQDDCCRPCAACTFCMLCGPSQFTRVMKNTCVTMLIGYFWLILIAGGLYCRPCWDGRVHCASNSRMPIQWLCKADRILASISFYNMQHPSLWFDKSSSVQLNNISNLSLDFPIGCLLLSSWFEIRAHVHSFTLLVCTDIFWCLFFKEKFSQIFIIEFIFLGKIQTTLHKSTFTYCQ